MRQIRISQYQFEISEPFQEGHQLSSQEALALNALRAENIRNLLAHKVRAAVEEAGGKLLGQAALAALREEASKLDRDYRFGNRRTVPRQGAIEREAKVIARSLLLSSKEGRDLEGEDLDRAIERASKMEDILAEARQRLEEQAQIANATLAELL